METPSAGATARVRGGTTSLAGGKPSALASASASLISADSSVSHCFYAIARMRSPALQQPVHVRPVAALMRLVGSVPSDGIDGRGRRLGVHAFDDLFNRLAVVMRHLRPKALARFQ